MNKANPPVYVLAALFAMLAANMPAPIARIIAFPWNLNNAELPRNPI